MFHTVCVTPACIDGAVQAEAEYRQARFNMGGTTAYRSRPRLSPAASNRGRFGFIKVRVAPNPDALGALLT
jgi:hypothetical protein